MYHYTVTEVNRYINKMISTDFLLADIEVEGEISNFIQPRSGHMYFNIKDSSSRLKSVMFRHDNINLKIEPFEGMKVVARGRISVYEKEGIYQFYVTDLREKGVGNIYKELEKLKQKLEEEGLFDDSKKKKIPEVPNNIGVVTSHTGAAVKDIIRVINRRYPLCNIYVYPSLVQGDKAAENIIKGLEYLDRREDIDLIIFGRGGGSTEELFAFNDENLVRTIYGLKTPNISAVGHEIDFTLADFVADLRASTPSVAGELAVPDISVVNKDLEASRKSIMDLMEKKFKNELRGLEVLKARIDLLNPMQVLNNRRFELESLARDLDSSLKAVFNKSKGQLLSLNEELIAMDPRHQLKKGEAFILNKSGDKLESIEDVALDEMIKIILKDGYIEADIRTIREDK